MPIVYQQNINPYTKIGLWHITEQEDFFSDVPLQREITHPQKRLQHLAGRYLLRFLFPQFPYDQIRIASTRKPFLENEAYHFSISHCGDYAAVMISTHNRVGVDVELISERVQKVKFKFLSADELQLLQQLNADVTYYDTRLLTLAWSIKESLYKWYGYGEMDFIDHLVIDHLYMQNDPGLAQCKILKFDTIELDAHFLFFYDHCLSWIVT